MILPLQNKLKSIKTFNFGNKSNNNLILNNNISNVISSSVNNYEAKYDNKNKNHKLDITNNNIKLCDKPKNKTINSNNFLYKSEENNSSQINKHSVNDNSIYRDPIDSLFKDYNDQIKITVFDYFCHRNNRKKKKMIELYHFGNEFYRRRLDIVLVFSHLLLTEKVLLSSNFQNKNSSSKDIEIIYPRI